MLSRVAITTKWTVKSSAHGKLKCLSIQLVSWEPYGVEITPDGHLKKDVTNTGIHDEKNHFQFLRDASNCSDVGDIPQF